MEVEIIDGKANKIAERLILDNSQKLSTIMLGVLTRTNTPHNPIKELRTVKFVCKGAILGKNKSLNDQNDLRWTNDGILEGKV